MLKIVATLGLIVALGTSVPANPENATKNDVKAEIKPPRPDPKYTPQQVVKIQLDALKKNDTPRPDAGIETTFAFASRANKKVTGPLERFTKMVKTPAYRPMIDHRSATLGVFFVEEGVANQRVTVIGKDGQIVIYLFSLSKDPETGCWMTDSVTIPPAVEA